MLGSVAGAWVFYGAGRWIDERRVRNLIERYGKWLFLSTADLDRSLTWFRRNGNWVVFFGRMVPMLRNLISIPAGLARMGGMKFTLYTALGTACWSFMLALAGRLLGENWSWVEGYLSRYEELVWGVLILGIAGFAASKIRSANRSTPGSPTG